ncbi:conserved hypothetical protein [Verticillium alfalfae VaMs.102]|uniref:Clr5 domain-containing protein n=1 Tax=Verticillium alfalfae (strain VaMs.102 / ATCC MYA-4576 / FGSC 10136) TaxID=526221 RepID=C9SX95_VERA1|nr:conserved hypothetical protein [Verticillium alfalfae VaMs.102]EEY23285.1 conserved hypothetical protein [Verticillium alfalfae VaMs.102]
MYKSRIWKWGLDKKLKGDEVLAILILKRDRDALERPTEFRIRGQLVDFENIKRYVKRNPALVAKLCDGHKPNVQTAREVTCRTPSPAPSQVLNSPADLYGVEKILGLFRDYVDGSFSSGSWFCEYNVDCGSSHLNNGDRSNELFERVIASFALVNRCMMRGDHIDINSVLGPSFESLKEIVAAESPDFVARTVCLLWYLDRHHKHDLLRLVLDYLAGLMPIIFGQHHVLAQIWRSLSATNLSDYYELSMRFDYLDCVFSRRGPEDCAGMITTHLARAAASGKRHPWIGDLALSHAGILAACEERQGRLDEAVAILTGHMNAYALTDEQTAAIHLELGVKYLHIGNTAAAIASFEMAVKIALTSNADERLSMTALGNLEKLLAETGKSNKANKIHEYRMRRVAAFAEKSASLAKGFETEDDANGESDLGDTEREELALWLWMDEDFEEPQLDWLTSANCMHENEGAFAPVYPNTVSWIGVAAHEAPGGVSNNSGRTETQVDVAEIGTDFTYSPRPGIQ